MLIFILKKGQCEGNWCSYMQYVYTHKPFVFVIATFVMLRGKQCCNIMSTKAIRLLHIFLYVAYSRTAATSMITTISQELEAISFTVSSWLILMMLSYNVESIKPKSYNFFPIYFKTTPCFVKSTCRFVQRFWIQLLVLQSQYAVISNH